MIIKRLKDIIGTDRDVAWGNGQSRRFLLDADGMGFTLTETTVEPGTASLIEYGNHLEACYCIEGEGEIEVEGIIYPIAPGTLYAPNCHDRHVLRASPNSLLKLVCVFLPALRGPERHDFVGAATGASSGY